MSANPTQIAQNKLFLEEEKRPPHPHTFSLTKKVARFTKGGFRPYQGPKWPYEGEFYGQIDRQGSCSKAAGGP